MVILTLGGFSSKQSNTNTLIPKRYLVLLMIVDVRGILDDAKEQRNSIFRQLGAYESRKRCVVKCLSGVRANLNSCTPSPSFVIGKTDAVDVRLGNTREVA